MRLFYIITVLLIMTMLANMIASQRIGRSEGVSGRGQRRDHDGVNSGLVKKVKREVNIDLDQAMGEEYTRFEPPHHTPNPSEAISGSPRLHGQRWVGNKRQLYGTRSRVLIP
jgi:hypothetical protein